MKIRKAIGLAVLLLIATGGVIAQGSKAKSLNSVIQELAPIARLTNGIALQTELSKDPKKVDDVVAEFLGVQSGEQLAKLKTMEVEGVAKSLKEFYEVVENVPQMNVDMQSLKQSFEALEEMKTNANVLKKTVTDPSAQLQNEIQLAKQSGGSYYYQVKHFTVLATELQYIKDNDIATVPKPFEKHLGLAKDALSNVDNQLRMFSNAETGLANLFAMENVTEKLKDVEKIATLLESYTRHFQSFSSMDTQLGNIKTASTHLKLVADKVQVTKDLAKSLNASSKLVSDLSIGKIASQLTVGFSNGASDLGKVLQDLDNPKVKALVSQGKDTKDLKSSLSILSSFQSKFKQVSEPWKAFDRKKYVESADAVTTVLSGTSTGSQQAPDFTKLETSLQSVQSCFNGLVIPQQLVGIDTTSVFKFARTLSQQIRQFRNLYATRKPEYTEQIPEVDAFGNVFANVTDNSVYPTLKTAWDTIRNKANIDKLIKFMKTVAVDFAPFQEENPFKTVRETVEWTVISTLLAHIKGTNMETMLDCAQQASYNPDDIATALSFGSSLQEMKTKKQEFNSTQTYLAELAKVKSGLLDVTKTITNFKKTRRSRRRRAANLKSLTNLRSAPDVSASLGKGVQVLREYCKILETQESVMVAVSAVDPLKSAVDGIQGAQSVWNDKNRKDMGVMVTDLNKLETFAGTMKKDNISELWKVFGEAGKVPDFTVDAKIFADPISVELANNADSQVQSKSADFQNIGGLNLDFARHRVDLFAASQAIQPLQQFFDDFFDNNKNVGGAQAQSSNAQQAGPSAGLIAGVVVGVLCLAGGGVGGWFGWKHYKKSERWKNRERHWIYPWAFNDYDADLSIISTIKEKRVGVLKRMIRDGYHVNTCQYMSIKGVWMWLFPLHAAVCYAQPEAVKLLIRGGADRSQWNSLNLTAEQQLDKCLVDERYKDERDALKKIKAIFQKYAKKTFRPRIRELMPIDRFSVKIYADDEHKKIAEAFAAKYPDIVRENDLPQMLKMHFQNRRMEGNKSECTHRVYPTDADGILDLDKMAQGEPTNKMNLRRMLTMIAKVPCIKISWLDECLKKRANFYKDYDYRITKFRYNGKVYETLDEWKKWKHRRAVSCLYNVAVAFYKLDDIKTLEIAVAKLGGEALTLEDLVTGSSTRKTAPYWFPKMNRHWIVHKGDAPDLAKVVEGCDAADLETNFVVMSIEEFFEHLFKLNGWKDLKPEPVIDGYSPKPGASSAQESVQSTILE